MFLLMTPLAISFSGSIVDRFDPWECQNLELVTQIGA